ncbi:hypothetical protein [Bradyrhizobium sp. SZCCHNR1051]|uniref:hypothetical protein n=1 Tax=Bradyrhizobium sp. SZCCHNR1051 TaxID=3057355 RepID=UPI00291612FB|nr:hypothetical protein [Bradyrhizobium sp. SZCCHNR1051]
MASRYSLTVQINPGFPGHAAVVVNEPGRQTFAGFGPSTHGVPLSHGKFDVHTLRPGETPPPDFSSVVDDGQYRSFTVPITPEQAASALNEIGRIRNAGETYNGLKSYSPNVCTTIVNRIMGAAGLGGNSLPRVLPSQSGEYLANIERELSANRKANVTFDGGGFANRIPDALRDIQSDYAFVGGGYDTPSERTGRLPRQASNLYETVPPPDDAVGMDRGSGRYLRSRRADSATATMFDSSTNPIPYIPRVLLGPQATRSGRISGSPDESGPAELGSSYRQLWPQPDEGDTTPSDFNDWYTRWVKPLREP